MCRPLGLLRVEAHKILSAAAAVRLSEAGLGRGARMCVRVICTCVRIVSGRPLRAVARSCWRQAPLGDRTQSVQTTVRIVLLFPSVLSLSFCENRKHLVFFILFFLRFWLFLSSPRFPDGFLRCRKNTKITRVKLRVLPITRWNHLDACSEYSHIQSPPDTHPQHIIIRQSCVRPATSSTYCGEKRTFS